MVNIQTSMGFSARRSIIANRLAYQFEEPLVAGTQISVFEGPAFAEVYTPSTFEYVSFDRVTGAVSAIAKGPSVTARITTSYGVDETVTLEWNGNNKTFEFILPNLPDTAFDFVLYIDQSHYTYNVGAKPAGSIDRIDYNVLTNQVWIVATGTDEAEATTSTGVTATINLSSGSAWFNIGTDPLPAGATITVTSLTDELVYTVPFATAFPSFNVDGKKVTVGGANGDVGFYMYGYLYGKVKPDLNNNAEYTFGIQPQEGDVIEARNWTGAQVSSYTVPPDPNANATFTTRMTLSADGLDGHKSNVQPGDTLYLVITPTGLVTEKVVNLSLNLQFTTAEIVGGNTVTLQPNTPKVVAINGITASGNYAFVGVSVMDPITGAYLSTSQSVNVPVTAVVPTTSTVNPVTANVSGTSASITYTFDQAEYSGKEVSITTSTPGCTATGFDLANNLLEDGNIYVTFDPEQLTDLEEIVVTVNIDGLEATTTYTYYVSQI